MEPKLSLLMEGAARGDQPAAGALFSTPYAEGKPSCRRIASLTMSAVSSSFRTRSSVASVTNEFNLEQLGPQFAGDEEAVSLGVVGNAVEDGFGISDFARF